MRKDISTLVTLLFLLLGASCEAARPAPTRAADLAGLLGGVEGAVEDRERSSDEQSLADLLRQRPQAELPTQLAVIRVQAPVSRNGASESGARPVVTACRPDEEAALLGLASVERIARVRLASELLAAGAVQGDLDLRRIGARLQSDVVLVYTLDGAWEPRGNSIEEILSLVVPTARGRATSTARGVILDTRSGFVFASEQASSQRDNRATVWGMLVSARKCQEKAEHEAFEALVERLASAWVQSTSTQASGG